MGTSDSSVGQFGRYLTTLAMASILFAGLGFFLEGIGTYITLVDDLASGLPFHSVDAPWIVLATLLLVISILSIRACIDVGRGVYPERTVRRILFLSALSLIAEGLGMFNVPSYMIAQTEESWHVSAVLAICAGIVLFLVLFTLSGKTRIKRFVCATLATAFAAILIARAPILRLEYTSGGPSTMPAVIYGYLANLKIGRIDFAPALTAGGILGFQYLALVAFLFLAVGLFTRVYLQDEKRRPIAWTMFLLGFLLYGVSMAWGNTAVFGDITYSVLNWPVATVPLIATALLSIAGFVIIATAILGLVIYGRGFPSALMVQPVLAQPAQVQVGAGNFCGECGARNLAENRFCDECGAKLD